MRNNIYCFLLEQGALVGREYRRKGDFLQQASSLTPGVALFIPSSPCSTEGKGKLSTHSWEMGHCSFNFDYLHVWKDIHPPVNRLHAPGTFTQSARTEELGPQIHTPMYSQDKMIPWRSGGYSWLGTEGDPAPGQLVRNMRSTSSEGLRFPFLRSILGVVGALLSQQTAPWPQEQTGLEAIYCISPWDLLNWQQWILVSTGHTQWKSGKGRH